MTETPLPNDAPTALRETPVPPMAKPVDARRKQKLAAQLRANLRRRKAAETE